MTKNDMIVVFEEVCNFYGYDSNNAPIQFGTKACAEHIRFKLASPKMVERVAEALWADRETPLADSGKTAQAQYRKQAKAAIAAVLEGL